jgi:hypothetical protein
MRNIGYTAKAKARILPPSVVLEQGEQEQLSTYNQFCTSLFLSEEGPEYHRCRSDEAYFHIRERTIYRDLSSGSPGLKEA